MTGLGVERMPRTACPQPSGSLAGVFSPLPPPIQGAERPTERRAGRTGFRWALRALVVGGLAGAAWLLTGAAAQAADRVDGPVGSLLGAVVESDTTAPVTGLLTAAAQPLELTRPAHQHRHHIVTDILDVPRRVLARPAKALDEVAHEPGGTTVDAVIGGADQVLREVAGPLRLTGGSTATQHRLTAVTVTGTRIPRPAAEHPRHPAGALVHVVDGPDRAVATSRATIDAVAVRRSMIGTTLRGPAAGVLRTAVPVRHGKAASTRSPHRSKPAAHPATAVPATGDTPGGDGPTDGWLHLGNVSGTPASWSGTPTEGGSAAFLPAAIASSTMVCQRLPIASDVEVRRTPAEAPTVSPD